MEDEVCTKRKFSCKYMVYILPFAANMHCFFFFFITSLLWPPVLVTFTIPLHYQNPHGDTSEIEVPNEISPTRRRSNHCCPVSMDSGGIIALLDEFLPHWMLKMPRNLQMTIVTLIIVHLVILLSIVGYVMSGQYSRSGRADFKAKLK